MDKKYTKEQIETIVMQSIYTRPYVDIMGSKIYSLETQGEELVAKNLKDCASPTTLMELEEVINNPDVKCIFIDKFAAITSKGLVSVLQRASLSKEVYCAFNIQI